MCACGSKAEDTTKQQEELKHKSEELVQAREDAARLAEDPANAGPPDALGCAAICQRVRGLRKARLI